MCRRLFIRQFNESIGVGFMDNKKEILQRLTQISYFARVCKLQNELGMGVYIALIKDLATEVEELLGVED